MNVNVTAPASCRMFPAGRQALWEEKLGLAPKFAGNAATRWGTRQEADALLRQGAAQAHAQTYCMHSLLASTYMSPMNLVSCVP